jgi:hypothetical protein
MEITSTVETIRKLIRRAHCNKHLKIEVKRGFGAMFG